jgi:hypothetical protein
MDFGETWASDPTVHNRYNSGPTSCSNGGSSYKSLAEDILVKLKDYHTDVQARMNSIKSSLDSLFTPNTATGIGVINSLITDDITPSLNSINTELGPMLDLGARADDSLALNLNCSFVK